MKITVHSERIRFEFVPYRMHKTGEKNHRVFPKGVVRKFTIMVARIFYLLWLYEVPVGSE